MAENPGIKEGDTVGSLTVLAIAEDGAYLGHLDHGLVNTVYNWNPIYRRWKDFD